ncbi:unnamed protein product [Linum trigynum]|uniref:Protein FAR1-RELATED SEQUENCE n=1 Tax=Linum trigynum TaxID=586398 RepID=A0AAV2EJE5_9ROSI
MADYELNPYSSGRDDGLIGYNTFYTRDGDDICWNERVVYIDVPNSRLECSCMLFKSMGIVCLHMLKVMAMLGDFGNEAMKTLPDHYILKRWTIDAKKKEVVESSTSVVDDEGAGNVTSNIKTLRYRETTTLLNKLATKLYVVGDDLYEKWLKALSKMCKSADHALSRSITSENGKLFDIISHC